MKMESKRNRKERKRIVNRQTGDKRKRKKVINKKKYGERKKKKETVGQIRRVRKKIRMKNEDEGDKKRLEGEGGGR